MALLWADHARTTCVGEAHWTVRKTACGWEGETRLTLSNLIFLPTAYSPAICFGRERVWWTTCNYPTVLKEKNIEKQKEYRANVRTTLGKASDRFRQRANKRNKNRVGRLLTSERNRKIILSDEVRRRIGKG